MKKYRRNVDFVLILDAKIAFKQLFEAIAYCHSQDIVHRDIKLENIVVDATSKVKLVDFGLSLNLKSCTKVSVSGTPVYLSPEIVTTRQHTIKPSDVWAAAVCLYRCVVGRFPFKGLNEVELYDQIKLGTVSLPSFMSAELADLLCKCFDKDPVSRILVSNAAIHPWFDFQSSNI